MQFLRGATGDNSLMTVIITSSNASNWPMSNLMTFLLAVRWLFGKSSSTSGTVSSPSSPLDDPVLMVDELLPVSSSEVPMPSSGRCCSDAESLTCLGEISDSG